MCDKTILKNSGTLKSFPECYKNQEMRNKTDDNYLYALEFVSGWYKTRKMCDKAVNRCLFVFGSILDWYKAQEMSHGIVSEDHSLIIYWSGKCKTLRMCDKVVNDSLPALELIPDWFNTSKMVQKRFTALYANENILYFNEDSDNVVFSCNEIGILNIDLDNNNNIDNNFEDDFSDTVILIRLLNWHIKFEKRKALKNW